ncbi:RIC1-domain-containing protein [Sistotremastrum suecicum HHB10207 ss-3]|uniref:RIC1-domain-containing protein n=1 Tax=Sistotremastrum suecicum HHB10207 ss-3 TaxID=1314776 RepID=A0A166B633_9AGAM|nr:RIC1-domain-containing protein [Sistotremastrum suecicum HHB10207 ss-3]
MYFPIQTARKLLTTPTLPHLWPSEVLDLIPSPRKSFFCALTEDGLTVWRVRPPVVLAHLNRSPLSIQEHGENKQAHWSPDGGKIVLQARHIEHSTTGVPYQDTSQDPNSQRHFVPGPGEGLQLSTIKLQIDRVIRVDGELLSVCPRTAEILFTIAHPPSVQSTPWPPRKIGGSDEIDILPERRDIWHCSHEDMPWLINPHITVTKIIYSRLDETEVWLTSDGGAYHVQRSEAEEGERIPSPKVANGPEMMPTPLVQPIQWEGTCIFESQPHDREGEGLSHISPQAVEVATNLRFSLFAIGLSTGEIQLVDIPIPGETALSRRTFTVPDLHRRTETGRVLTMQWSSDGCVLAVGWVNGWAVWSISGRCLVWAVMDEHSFQSAKLFNDMFMHGVKSMFWGPSNFELIVLAKHSVDGSVFHQLFSIPFAKSSVTGQQTPDNTRYAFLQMDDKVLVYRGADQPDMSVINPESDVWQHIKIPGSYMATNWPIRYGSISADGRLIAVAGRRGLVHYSTTSGRWKTFSDPAQEQAFSVRGGLLWFHHVLIAAVEVSGSYQVRLFSRDLDLSSQTLLHREILSCPVVLISLVDNSLLLYSADNTLSHYLIVPTADAIKLHLCGSINFDGIITSPGLVRSLSWMIPNSQKTLGDPVDDLTVATVLMLIGGRLVLLRPRRSGNQEVKYDVQIMADGIEFCWIHLRGIGSLENSLWGYDGQNIRIWLDALSIDSNKSDQSEDTYGMVKESVKIPLDFYPLSVLMDKGIIIGAEHDMALRSAVPFSIFRIVTSTHMFLHHVLRIHLERLQVDEAVQFASYYQKLVFFAHGLEMLLHSVLETEAAESDRGDLVLRAAVEFLDHFDDALDVVVGCARKTEMARWGKLFDKVGNPKTLFELCLASQRYRTAGSYLLVLHNLAQTTDLHDDTVRLLKKVIDVQDWALCRDLVRFLYSMDESGSALRAVMTRTGLELPTITSSLPS